MTTSLACLLMGKVIESSKDVKLLGIIINKKPSFKPHVGNFAKKTNEKIKALLRIRNHLTHQKADLLRRTFVLSPFNCCPLMWMYSGKEANNLINDVQRRSLRAVLNEFSLKFEEMLFFTGENILVHKHLPSGRSL